jgi:hypothetical protein
MELPEESKLVAASTKGLVKLAQDIAAELEKRGGPDVGTVWVFQKKKDGSKLNKDNKFVGGKLCATFEFKDEVAKKTKEFFIALNFRGVLPQEDKVSKYADQARYRLVFDPADDLVIIGCYVE